MSLDVENERRLPCEPAAEPRRQSGRTGTGGAVRLPSWWLALLPFDRRSFGAFASAPQVQWSTSFQAQFNGLPELCNLASREAQ